MEPLVGETELNKVSLASFRGEHAGFDLCHSCMYKRVVAAGGRMLDCADVMKLKKLGFQ